MHIGNEGSTKKKTDENCCLLKRWIRMDLASKTQIHVSLALLNQPLIQTKFMASRGKHSTMVTYLLPDPAALGLIPSILRGKYY